MTPGQRQRQTRLVRVCKLVPREDGPLVRLVIRDPLLTELLGAIDRTVVPGVVVGLSADQVDYDRRLELVRSWDRAGRPGYLLESVTVQRMLRHAVAISNHACPACRWCLRRRADFVGSVQRWRDEVAAQRAKGHR